MATHLQKGYQAIHLTGSAQTADLPASRPVTIHLAQEHSQVQSLHTQITQACLHLLSVPRWALSLAMWTLVILASQVHSALALALSTHAQSLAICTCML